MTYHCPFDSLGDQSEMLREKIKESLKDAMRAKEQRRVSTLRLILAAVKDRDIALRTEDTSEQDDDKLILDILSKMVKQRHDSIKAYEEGGRLELAEQERQEIEIISEFLPEQLDDDAIEKACKEAVRETGAESLKDMGKVMGQLKAKFAGVMDFSKASQTIKDLLS